MAETKKTIAELEETLTRDKKYLRELHAKIHERRKQLMAEIAKVNEEIASLTREYGAPAKARAVREGRPKRLPQYILEVLKASPTSLTAAEIAAAVTKAGYRSSSGNFVGLVRRTCYMNDSIGTKERGKFAIKGKK